MEIKNISPTDTHFIRHEILRKGRPIEECIFAGDDEEHTFHLGAFVDKKLVSVASFYFENNPLLKEQNQMRIRGMATLTDYQGKGFSAELLSLAFPIAKQNNCEIIWCNARKTAIGFYQKIGFEMIGEEFEVEGVGPHYLMCKTIV